MGLADIGPGISHDVLRPASPAGHFFGICYNFHIVITEAG